MRRLKHGLLDAPLDEILQRMAPAVPERPLHAYSLASEVTGQGLLTRMVVAKRRRSKPRTSAAAVEAALPATKRRRLASKTGAVANQ